MRALIIEDSRTQAAKLAAVLRRAGFDVAVAHDGAAGLALCRAEPPRVVVSDIVMPGVDGFEVCRALKADPSTRAVPVVLLTSLADPLDVVRGLAAGADSFLPKPYDEAALVERVRRFAERGVRAAGDATVEVGGQLVAVEGAQGRVLDVLVAALEAAAARHAETERQHAATQLAVRDRDELVAIVSHDLRNPLAAIVAAAAMAEKRPDDAEGLKQKLAMIRRSAERMTRLINDLLDVTRMEAGRLPFEREPVDVGAAVEEAVLSQRTLADQKRVRLQTDLPASLPAVSADRERLQQVFANLLGNAIKFTPEGGDVSVRAEVGGGAVCFTVADTGPGIPAEDLPRVFDRFWQAGRTARQGTGLGLPIVKGIVESHGGQVWVESTVGRGTAFSFTVPVEPAVGGRA